MTLKLELTDEEIRLLAQAERNMDDGTTPFVKLHEHRIAVQPKVMEELNLRQGQTINDVIFRAILRHHIAWCETEIALKKAGDHTAKTESQ